MLKYICEKTYFSKQKRIKMFICVFDNGGFVRCVKAQPVEAHNIMVCFYAVGLYRGVPNGWVNREPLGVASMR